MCGPVGGMAPERARGPPGARLTGQDGGPMATSVFIMPIIPGKEDFDRETLQRMAAPGPEHDGYVAARRSQGITREAVWHQRTPMGTSAIVLMEGEDINAAMGAMITGQDPFNTRFR